VGRRYGLIGQNGCGKSNFLHCISTREIPLPDHIDIYHLQVGFGWFGLNSSQKWE
jgi:ATP-binding cassette subfamily F protein 2